MSENVRRPRKTSDTGELKSPSAIQLRALMKRFRITKEKLAEITGNTPSAVNSWLRPKSSKASRRMRAASLSALKNFIAENHPPT